MRLVIATYNVHRCVGSDGRRDPDRVAAVIRELDADVIGLQEVDSRPSVEAGLDQVAYLAEATGLVGIAGVTRQHDQGDYGNALLTRHPVCQLRRLDLSVPRREPRGAIEAEIEVDGVGCTVIVTHLGLKRRERRRQLAQLVADCFLRRERRPTVLLGDLNEWSGAGRVLHRLPPGFAWRAAASFPAWLPLLALDGMVAYPGAALASVGAHASRLARRASDHLPVRGELRSDRI